MYIMNEYLATEKFKNITGFLQFCNFLLHLFLTEHPKILRIDKKTLLQVI